MAFVTCSQFNSEQEAQNQEIEKLSDRIKDPKEYQAGDGLTLNGERFSVNVDNNSVRIVNGNLVATQYDDTELIRRLTEEETKGVTRDNRLTSLETELQIAKNQINDHENRILELENQNTQLQNQVSNLIKSINKLELAIETLKGQEVQDLEGNTLGNLINQ